MHVDLSKIDFAGIQAAANRERRLAVNALLFQPVAHLFLRLAKPELRRPSGAFQSIRGC